MILLKGGCPQRLISPFTCPFKLNPVLKHPASCVAIANKWASNNKEIRLRPQRGSRVLVPMIQKQCASVICSAYGMRVCQTAFSHNDETQSDGRILMTPRPLTIYAQVFQRVLLCENICMYKTYIYIYIYICIIHTQTTIYLSKCMFRLRPQRGSSGARAGVAEQCDLEAPRSR